MLDRAWGSYFRIVGSFILRKSNDNIIGITNKKDSSLEEKI